MKKIKTTYLTFDDGPHPTITPWVLDQLKTYNQKATFFCVGAMAQKSPEIISRIEQEGHTVGNHTWNHVNGWKAKTKDYLEEVERTKELLNTKLFRPPYGRITPMQYYLVSKQQRIKFWSILAKDYDASLSGDICFSRIKNRLHNNSVILLHDSEKAEKNLKHALPRTLELLMKQGYISRAL